MTVTEEDHHCVMEINVHFHFHIQHYQLNTQDEIQEIELSTSKL